MPTYTPNNTPPLSKLLKYRRTLVFTVTKFPHPAFLHRYTENLLNILFCLVDTTRCNLMDLDPPQRAEHLISLVSELISKKLQQNEEKDGKEHELDTQNFNEDEEEDDIVIVRRIVKQIFVIMKKRKQEVQSVLEFLLQGENDIKIFKKFDKFLENIAFKLQDIPLFQRFIIKYGSSKDSKQYWHNKRSLFDRACSVYHLEVVKFLVENANVNYRKKSWNLLFCNMYPIYSAIQLPKCTSQNSNEREICMKRSLSLVQYLVSLYKKDGYLRELKRTGVVNVAYQNGNLLVLKFLHGEGFDITSNNEFLTSAVSSKCIDTVLLLRNLKTTEVDSLMYTALYSSLMFNSLEIFFILEEIAYNQSIYHHSVIMNDTQDCQKNIAIAILSSGRISVFTFIEEKYKNVISEFSYHEINQIIQTLFTSKFLSVESLSLVFQYLPIAKTVFFEYVDGFIDRAFLRNTIYAKKKMKLLKRMLPIAQIYPSVMRACISFWVPRFLSLPSSRKFNTLSFNP